jgi:hypothetical protein
VEPESHQVALNVGEDSIGPVVGAVLGSAIGRIGGQYLADALLDPLSASATTKDKALHALVQVGSSAVLAAVGSAIGAPADKRKHAALGAALGGIIPMPKALGNVGGTVVGSAASGVFSYVATR